MSVPEKTFNLQADKLKQKIMVNGISYELQSIYGMDQTDKKKEVCLKCKKASSCLYQSKCMQEAQIHSESQTKSLCA